MLSPDNQPKQDAQAGPDLVASAVTLVKGPHRWVFSCSTGEEGLLLARVADLARDQGAPLDWFDAALIRHQLSGRLRPGINRVPETTENM